MEKWKTYSCWNETIMNIHVKVEHVYLDSAGAYRTVPLTGLSHIHTIIDMLKTQAIEK